MKSTGRVGVLIMACVAAVSAPSRAAVGVLVNSLPGAATDIGAALIDALSAAGLAAQPLAPSDLLDAALVSPATLDLLLLTDAGRLPAAAAPLLERYLDAGGNLIALGAPLFDETSVLDGGTWLSRKAYERARNEVVAEHLIDGFDYETAPPWTRSTDNDAGIVSATTEAPGATGAGRCLRVEIDHLTNWELLYSQDLAAPLPAGHTLTCLWAKGDGRTGHLMVEWMERDGSRWIATVPLSTEWQHVALAEDAFTYWPSVEQRRGGRLSLAGAQRLTIGVAVSHLGHPGPQAYWVDEIGTATDPWAARGLSWEVSFRPRDGLWPAYKVYDATDVARLEPAELPMPARVRAAHPRPEGTGFDKRRDWRWLPWITAHGADGDWRGACAIAVLERKSGAAYAAYTIPDTDWYRREETRANVVQLVRRLIDDAFFYEAGAPQYTYFADQSIRAGARVFARGAQRAEPHFVQFHIFQHGRPVQWKSPPLPLELGAGGIVEATYDIGAEWTPAPATAEYRLAALLLRGGIEPTNAVDYICHDLALWLPPAQPNYVTASAGDFIRDGSPWIVHAVNYMPSSGIAVEEYSFFEHWLGRPAYGPEVMQRDLERVAALGFNAVSVFIDHQSLDAMNLLDFLRRCERLDLKVNLSLRPGTPMDFQWEKIKAIIETYRLASNDTVFAYDLAWEPHHNNDEGRARYAGEWTRFVIERHTSLEQAFAVWGVTAEIDNETLRVPSNAQLFNEGPWTAMVADYRAFLDQLLARHYAAARDLVRGIDPHHLVSFRKWLAGDPTYSWGIGPPYDLEGLGQAVDLFGLEAYGRMGDWERVKPGVFSVAYARAVNPALPVFWAEAGMHVWDEGRMAADPAKLEAQARFYEDVYKMLLLSHSNGVAHWWYPGGYRVNERSDYGIINPDGTDRPVTAVIRRYGPLLTALGKTPQPTVYLDVDRRRYATGIVGVYAEIKDEYWRLVDAGEVVGLRLLHMQDQ